MFLFYVEFAHSNMAALFLEGSQPEGEAGGDGDVPRHLVPAGGHATEIL